MNATEFERAARELRRRQRRYFATAKESPDKRRALEEMRAAEQEMGSEVARVRAMQRAGRAAGENERRLFFNAVAEMLARQERWAKSHSFDDMRSAREVEKAVDELLRLFDGRRQEEKRRAAAAAQYNLFGS